MKRLACLVCALVLCGAVAAGAAQPPRDASRDVFLQTIGMLAGQGLVLGHEALDGIYGRFEKGLMPREKAEQALADQARYADWVLAAFKERLMGRLTEQEKRDLALLIGFYEVERQAIAALATYVHAGGSKNREQFESQQERVAAIIRQISLGGGAP